MKNYISNLFVTLFGFTILMGCSPTPNNISIGTNQGQCLTGGIDGAPLANPATAGYCMSVTLQNNNSGQNANNVQVTSAGVTLGYIGLTNSGYQTYSNIICDNNASSGVCPSGTNQIGNITIYDPNNCATQQGSKVNTLMANGGTCTFYLQIAAESFALGSYPIGITYNYTNSNQNYSISTIIYQNVNLYTTGNAGLYLLNNSEFQLAESGNNTNIATRDNYGNLYFNVGNLIYKYNGLTYVQLANPLPSAINSIAVDNNANLIVATASSGLYFLNVNNGTNWSPLVDNNNLLSSTSSILGVSYNNNSSINTVYATVSNASYSCIESINQTPTIACTLNPNGPSQFYPNSIYSYSGVMYAGIAGGIESYSAGTWGNYTFIPAIVAGGYSSSLFVNSTGITLGLNSSGAIYTESSIYNCSFIGTSCTPESSGTGNYISGNISGVVADGAGYLYGVGHNINSADFSGTNNGLGFFESLNNSGVSIWQQVTNQGESFNSPLVVSSLVN